LVELDDAVLVLPPWPYVRTEECRTLGASRMSDARLNVSCVDDATPGCERHEKLAVMMELHDRLNPLAVVLSGSMDTKMLLSRST